MMGRPFWVSAVLATRLIQAVCVLAGAMGQDFPRRCLLGDFSGVSACDPNRFIAQSPLYDDFCRNEISSSSKDEVAR